MWSEFCGLSCDIRGFEETAKTIEMAPRTFISTFTTPGRAPLTLRIATPCFSRGLPPKKKKEEEEERLDTSKKYNILNILSVSNRQILKYNFTNSKSFLLSTYIIEAEVKRVKERERESVDSHRGKKGREEKRREKRATSEARFPFSTFYNPRARMSKGVPLLYDIIYCLQTDGASM